MRMDSTGRWFVTILPVCLVTLAVAINSAVAAPVLWLRADEGISLDDNGGVANWTDQSGQGHDAFQNELNDRPLWVANGLNGLPVVRFNGTQTLDLLGQVLTSQQFTIIAVLNDARLSGDVARREIFSNWDVSNATTSIFLGTVNDDPTRVRLSDNFGGTDPPYNQQGAGPLDNPATHFILTGLSGATDALQFQNSSLIASLGAALSPRVLDTAYFIGKQGTLTDENWIGDLAELRIYDEALSNDELQRIWTELEIRYGIAVPEPSSVILGAIGALALVATARRKRRAETLAP